MKPVRSLIPLFATAAGLLASPPARADGPSTVTLHVDSPYVVQVEHRNPDDTAWAPVCTNPCDVEVPVVGQYRVKGRGVTTSTPITLTPQGSSAILQIAPGSKNKERNGWFLVGGAATAIVVGAVLDAAAATQGTVAGEGGPGDPGTNSNGRMNFYLAGTTLIIAGLATAFYGGALAYANAHSTVRENDARPNPPARTPEVEVEASRDAVTREAEAALAREPALVLPLVTLRF
jgi:hypothetical protein